MFNSYILTLVVFYTISRLTRKHKYSLVISIISSLLFHLYISKNTIIEKFEGQDIVSSGDFIELKKVEYEKLENYGYLGYSVKSKNVIAGKDNLNNKSTLFKIINKNQDMIKHGDVIFLQNQLNSKYLSKEATKNKLVEDSFNISLIENINESSTWVIEIEGEGNLTKESKFKIRHQKTGYYLLITDKMLENKVGLAVLLVSSNYLQNSSKMNRIVYTLERAENKNNRGLRLYEDVNWKIGSLSKYHLSNSTDVDVEEIDFISRKGYNELHSCYVPVNKELLFFRGKKEEFSRLSSGWHNNLDLGNINRIVLQKSCGAKLYSLSNYKGKSLCLMEGMHKLPFKPKSWKLSPDFNVKLYSNDNQVLINDNTNTELRNVAQTAPLDKLYNNVNEILISKLDNSYIDNLNKRDEVVEQFTSNYNDLAINSLDKYLPNIKKDNIKCFLDATNEISYNNEYPKIWKDISGNNNHLIFEKEANYGFGKVLLNQNKLTPRHISEYVNLLSNEFTVITFGEFSNNKYNLLPYVVRRKNDVDNGKIMKRQVDGTYSLISKDDTTFRFDKDISPIFNNNFVGNIQIFMVYNVRLNDEDINSIIDLVNKNYINYLNTRDTIVKSTLHETIKNYPISTNRLRCYLSGMYSSSLKVWKDLSGSGNDFEFKTEPKLLGNKYSKIDMAGLPSNEIGLENGKNGYTIFVYFRIRAGSGNIKLGSNNVITISNSNVEYKDTIVNLGSLSKVMNVVCIKKDKDGISTYLNGIQQNNNGSVTQDNIFDNTKVEFKLENIELGEFVIYSKSLSNPEIRLLSDWIRKPNYGSNKKLTGEIDNRSFISSGLCVSVGNYDFTDCISWKDGSIIDNNGKGFCYTSKDKKKRGYCSTKQERIDIDDKYKTESMTWNQSNKYCESRGGRLCNSNELTLSGEGTYPRTTFGNLSEKECELMGGEYKNGKCTLNGETMILPEKDLWTPVNDGINEWVAVASKDKPESIGKKYSVVNGNKPEWGENDSNEEYKRATLCCGIKNLTRCEKVKLFERRYKELKEKETNEDNKSRYENQRKRYEDEYNRDCRQEKYFDAYNKLNNFKTTFDNLITRMNNATTDKNLLIRDLIELNSYVDEDGNKKLEKVINGYDDLGNPKYKRYGKIPELIKEINKYNEGIKEEKERQKNCPKDMECTSQQVTEVPDYNVMPLEIEGKCSSEDLRDALIDSRALDNKSYQDIKKILSTENILSNLDIKHYGKYHQYFEKDKAPSCRN